MFEFENRFLEFQEYLVIADLHLGIEYEMGKTGYNVPSQAHKMIESIKKKAKKSKKKKLIILGDLKHQIPFASSQEKREVPFFIRRMKEIFDKIVLIKGNHDGKIEKMVDVPVKKEMVVGKVGFIHGHAMPSDKFLEKTSTIVMGHMHPSYGWEDHLGHYHKKPCWIIGEWKDKKVIIMPAFNELFSGAEKPIGPFSDQIEKKEVILTDMTKML